jgi:hypothetical protein
MASDTAQFPYPIPFGENLLGQIESGEHHGRMGAGSTASRSGFSRSDDLWAIPKAVIHTSAI